MFLSDNALRAVSYVLPYLSPNLFPPFDLLEIVHTKEGEVKINATFYIPLIEISALDRHLPLKTRNEIPKVPNNFFFELRKKKDHFRIPIE